MDEIKTTVERLHAPAGRALPETASCRAPDGSLIRYCEIPYPPITNPVYSESTMALRLLFPVKKDICPLLGMQNGASHELTTDAVSSRKQALCENTSNGAFATAYSLPLCVAARASTRSVHFHLSHRSRNCGGCISSSSSKDLISPSNYEATESWQQALPLLHSPSAVKPTTRTQTRDRRASSAIVVLERHHSSVAPHYEDCIASGDEDGSAEDDGATVNTSLRTEYTPMMKSPNSNTSQSSEGRGKWKERFARYRVLEFTLSLIMIALAGVLALIGVYDRDIPHIEIRMSSTQTVWARDPTIDNKKMKEQVPMVALLLGATGVPIVTNLFINYVLPKFKRIRVIPFDTRDFLLSMAQSAGISQVLTQFMKNMTGRFRPCFYEMCKWDFDAVWDGVTNLCQDKKWEKEGRRSFPSGHSSYAWCTLFLLTLYLMGRSRLNCENRDETILRGGRKTVKLFLCFLPTLFATWIAITRSVDNWHHYTDILTGSMIGALAAGFGYSYNYGSIFSWESAGVPNQEFHSRRKLKDREHQEVIALLTNSRSGEVEPHSTQSHSSTSYTSTKGDIVLNVR